MTQEQLALLKSQLPINLNITMSMDYPNGILPRNDVSFIRPDKSIGKFDIAPEYDSFVKITGTIGQTAVVITWKYNITPEEVLVDCIGPLTGDTKTIPFSNLKDFLLKLI